MGQVKVCPTMHYFGIRRDNQSVLAFKILTEYLWEFCQLYYGNYLNMPYWDYPGSSGITIRHPTEIGSGHVFLTNDLCNG